MPLNITNGEDFYQRGAALVSAGELEKGREFLLRAVAGNPGNWRALNDLGLVEARFSRFEAAEKLFRESLRIQTHAASYANLGRVLRVLNRNVEAMECFDKALALDGNFVDALNARAMVRLQSARVMEAMEDWRAILRISEAGKMKAGEMLSFGDTPDIVGAAVHNLGSASRDLGRIEDALRFHRLSWDRPAHPNSAFGDWLPTAHGNWLMDHGYAARMDAAQVLEAHRDWWRRYTSHITPMEQRPVAVKRERLRIGFVSADFQWHSVAYFLLPLFEHFDRSRFEFYCYSNSPGPDKYTGQFQKMATAWRDIVHLKDDAVGQLVRNDGIDILFDLGGHTSHGRLRLFAYQAAPVQVSWLGYPLTTGSPRIQWRISDDWADPVGMTEAHFSERILRLNRSAWCFRPLGAARAEEIAPSQRGKGLPFTFGSFNAISKVTDEMIEVWSRILLAVPGSRLCIKRAVLGDEIFRQSMSEKFASQGVEAERLLLQGLTPNVEDHLAAYNTIDLALDTYPYHGTTTTCEALWMNVPVVTLAGETHRARVGVSLLTAAGLPGLVAESVEEYAELAIHYATHAGEFAVLRKNLRARVESSALMDEAVFAAAFGEGLERMWAEWVSDGRQTERESGR